MTPLDVQSALPKDPYRTFAEHVCIPYSVTTIPGREKVRALSEELPGSLYYGGYYIKQVLNNEKSVLFVDAEEVPAIEKAREVTASITGLTYPAYTYTGMARQIMLWLGIDQEPCRFARRLIPHWHYQKCLPARMKAATMYDIRSAYWQIASRCPTPKPLILHDRIVWQSVTREQQSRWDTLRADLQDQKKLRLALVGVNAVGWRKSARNVRRVYRYCAGRLVGAGNPIGRLQPLSILAVRCTYELTQLQTEASGGVYANGDCVVTDGAPSMQLWDAVGIQHTIKAQGPANICGLGIYQIGNRKTKGFDVPKVPEIAAPFYAASLPDPVWHTRVLH